MNSIRKWLYKPKKTDQSLLAQFFYADEDLNAVTSELDSFDGRKDPDRCTALVNHLRQCQDKVLNICQMLMDEVIPEDRAHRDFRAKFPDDVLQENLAGQLWFGAECLAAGSSILNRELESTTMRPLAKAFTKSLENVRNLLREQCFRNPPEFTEKICESLKILDRLFAEFELSYVSAMVPVKTVHEYEAQQAITVLFSETLQRALRLGLLCQDQVDSCDPAVMFTIPRLAIVAGLLIFPDGPLCLDTGELSEMFRPFRSLLLKIRELLWTLSRHELSALERALCSSEEPDPDSAALNEDLKSNHNESPNHQIYHHHQPPPPPPQTSQIYGIIESGPEFRNGQHSIQDYLDQFCKDFPQCREFISDLCNSSTSQHCSTESNNEMSVSQYSMNLSQSSGGGSGEIPPSSGTRHQLIVNAVTVVNHANGNCYVEEGETVGSCCSSSSGSMGSDTIRSFCCDEERKFYEPQTPPTPLGTPAQFHESDEIHHQVIIRPNELNHNLNNSSYEEEIPTPVVEILNSPDNIDEDGEIVPKCHASSSSSHDSGLSSMAQLSPATNTTDSSPSFDFPNTLNTPEEFSSYEPNPSSTTSVVSSSKTNRYSANGGTGSGSKNLLQVPHAVEIQHRPQHGNHHTKDITVCTGSCCNIQPGVSPSEESACDTSSFDSECQDDVEIALALQAAEIATRTEARSRFKNSADLIHRLFICISGVADQLQTNYAADLRSVLKCVFVMNATPGDEEVDESSSSTPEQDTTPEPSLDEELHDSEVSENNYQVDSSQSAEVITPPSWVPDEAAPLCMACLATFTVVRRRHHCRACGKVFCGKCSGNSVPLPRYGYGMKPQRVCNTCFVYRVTPFTLPSSAVSLH